MSLRWLPAVGVVVVAAGVGLLALSGCGGTCDAALEVCGSDGFLHSECDLPIGVNVIPDLCCRFDDGGEADLATQSGAVGTDLCEAPEECRVNQPGTCIPPGSTLLPDGGILLADGGLFQGGGDGGF